LVASASAIEQEPPAPQEISPAVKLPAEPEQSPELVWPAVKSSVQVSDQVRVVVQANAAPSIALAGQAISVLVIVSSLVMLTACGVLLADASAIEQEPPAPQGISPAVKLPAEPEQLPEAVWPEFKLSVQLSDQVRVVVQLNAAPSSLSAGQESSVPVIVSSLVMVTACVLGVACASLMVQEPPAPQGIWPAV
jgi:hypothetical protein